MATRIVDMLADLGEDIIDNLIDFWDQSAVTALVTMILLSIGMLLLVIGLSGT